MALPDFKNWRFNPFTSVFNPVAIVDETHIVEFFEESNMYGIQLFEAPELQTPFYIVIQETGGGPIFTEVPRSTAPSSGQFRIDYDAETFFGTALIEFNAADDITEVEVDYRGLGTVVKQRYQLLQVTVIPTNLGVEGDLVVQDNLEVQVNTDLQGNLQVGGQLTAPFNLGTQRVFDSLDPTDGSDLGDRDFNDHRYIDQLNFQNDNDFSNGFWELLTGASLVDDSASGGTLTTLRLTGADNPISEFKPGQRSKFIPIKNVIESVWSEIVCRKDGSFDGNIRIQIQIYDKSKIFLNNRNHVITNSALSGGYRAFEFIRNFINDPFAEFFKIRLSSTAATTGNAFVKHIRQSFFPVASSDAINNSNNLIHSIPTNWQYVSQTIGIGGLTFIPAMDSSFITLTGSFVNYDILGTGKDDYRKQAKLALVLFKQSSSAPGTVFDGRVNVTTPNNILATIGLAFTGITFTTGVQNEFIIPVPVYGHNLNANNLSNVRMNRFAGSVTEFKFLGFFI